MANLLGKMGQRLSQAASSAKEKSQELLDTAKLNKRVSELEAAISQMKEEIGEQVYAAYSAGNEPEQLLERCEQIDSLHSDLVEARQELSKLRGITYCPRCGAMLESRATFCPSCGSKL